MPLTPTWEETEEEAPTWESTFEPDAPPRFALADRFGDSLLEGAAALAGQPEIDRKLPTPINPQSQRFTSGADIRRAYREEPTPNPTRAISSAIFPESEPEESLLGISPEMIPAGKGPVTVPLSSVARTATGIASYLTSPDGITELVASMSPAKLLVMGKWATDMAKGAGEELGTLSTLVAKPDKTLEDWQELSDHTVNSLAMIFGAGKVGSEIGAKATGIRAPVGRALIEPITIGRKGTLAKDLAQRLSEAEMIPLERAALPENIGGAIGGASENLPADAQAIEAANKAKMRADFQKELDAQAEPTIKPAPIDSSLIVEPIKETGGVTGGPLTVPVSGELPPVPTPGKPATPTKPAALVAEPKTDGSVVRVTYRNASGEEVGYGQLDGNIINMVSVGEAYRRKGVGVEIIKDLRARGGLYGVAGTPEGLALMRSKAVGAREYEPNKFTFEADAIKETGGVTSEPLTPLVSGERPLVPEPGIASLLEQRRRAVEALPKPTTKQEAWLEGDPFLEGQSKFSQSGIDVVTELNGKISDAIDDAASRREPLPAQIEEGQFAIPEGYVREGDRYVYKPKLNEQQPAETAWEGQSFFDVQSEAQGLGRPSTRPTVEDVRRSRESGSPPPVEPSGKSTPGTLSESERMRKLSERATTSDKIPEPVQEQIKGSPESYYRQQSLNKVEEAVRGMSDADLGAVAKDSDIYTAAKLEQATRLFDSGNSEAGYRVFQDLSTELTRLGQVINQAKLFQALRPEHVVTVVNKELVKAGKDPLTAEQAGRVKGLADARIQKQADLQKATKEWTKDPTDANAVKAEKALTDANKAALAEQNLVNQFKPRSLPAIIKSILQGNLLVPISHVANVVGNVNFMPFRAGVRTIASGIDILDSYLRNRPRQVSVAPIKGGRPSAEGLIKGVKQIPAILAKGTGEVIKGESRAGLHPLRAWVKQFAKNPDIPTVGGKIPFSERVNLAIEGTFGVPAEVMLRVLGAGDIPFSELARSRLIAEQSRLSKLSPGDARMAKNFPELFFDKAALDKINNETRGAVFQRHSKTLDHLLSWIKGRGDWFDLAVAFVAPYKLTPWNIVGEILSYNPLIAMGRTALEAKRGNIRVAEMNAAKVIVGSTLVYAGYWLYEKGLLSPSLDDKGEQQKARILAGEVMPPNHVNLSGLKRAMAGGDPAFKAGDETVDIFRGGGLAGSMFYMMANVGRDAETKPEAEQAILSLLKNSTLEQARFGLNQSFLKGVTGLLDAVRDGDADTYVQSLSGTVLSVPLPNTLSAISRAERKYKVDATDKNLVKQVEKVVRTRIGFAGMDDYLPLKRGLWGEPLRETPENRNALVYHFFDISKNRQVTSDPVPLELYRLWRKTANTSVIPTPPDKTLTVGGETYLMNPAQRSRYAELIGTARRSIASQIVTNPEWHKLPDEIKIDLLGKVYDNGLKIGKAQFFGEVGGSLEKKPKKAGFK